MSDKPSDDPFLDAQVERAMAPYRAMGLSIELLAEMERLLRFALTEHPTGKHLMKRMRPIVVEQSGPKAAEEANGAPAKAGSSR